MRTPLRKAKARQFALAPSWGYASAIVLAGALLYANSLSGPFVFDDLSSVVNNAHIRALWPLSEALSPPTEGEPVAGRPIANLSLAVNYAVGQLDVRSYHIANIALHIACALLLFGVIRHAVRAPNLEGRFSERSAANLAFACALLWAVHPLQTEVVDYVSARTESLMSGFYLLTLYASIRAFEARQSTSWLVAATLACAMGMACKETMATAPLMVVLFDRIFLFGSFHDAFSARGRWYVVLAATWLVLAALVLPGPRSESAGFFTSVRPWTYLLNQSAMIAHYLRLAVWPRSLVFDYGVPQDFTFGQVAPYVALVVGLLAATAALLAWQPPLGFLGAWFFIILAPSSSFIPISSEVGAESRMYLPLAAIVVFAVIAAHEIVRRFRLPTTVAVAGTVAVCGVLAVATVRRNAEYQSGVALWRTVLERRPHARAHRNLALELKAAGGGDEMLAEWREVVREQPDSRYELGRDLYEERRFDEAVAELQRFIREYPKDEAVPAARSLIALALADEGKPVEAAQQWREILKLRPGDTEAKQALADALLGQKDFEGARAAYTELLTSTPGNAAAWTNLGVALSAANHSGEAMSAFRRAVELNPEDEQAQLGLATGLLGERDVDGAIEHAGAAARTTPGDPAAHTLLGIALLGRARIDEAIAQFEASLSLAPGDQVARDGLQQALTVKRLRGSPQPTR
jgi:tetratricopeptide (TPR) repeat protein